MRIAVTGATGFLGSALVDRALEAGHRPIGLGRDWARGHGIADRGAMFVQCDLSNVDGMARAFERADAVIHSAALSAPWGRPADFRTANVAGTANVVEACRKAGVGRLVHVSTPSVYFRFADVLNVDEGSALPPPVNDYAATKLEAEGIVRASGLEAFVMRPRGLFGEGDTTLLPRIARVAAKGSVPLLRGGEATVDVTHVDDAARAMLAAVEAPASASGVYNVSQGDPLTVRDLVEEAMARVGLSFRWKPVPVRAALAAARAAEAACRLLPGRPEPIVTAYGIGLLAYSQTLNLFRIKAALGWQAERSVRDALDLTLGKRP